MNVFVKIFDFFFSSNFKIKMKKKMKLLQEWKCEYKDDGYEEIFKFTKDIFILKFAEDLREHSILFTIFYNHHKVFEAGYKVIIQSSPDFDSTDLEKTLKNAKTDVEEVDAYFQFLIQNNLIN